MMDTPDNYYAILGVPLDADEGMLKRAYRQLARRYHPDLAGPEGATQMKRINRAYAVLSDAEQRLNYDMIIGGSIDLRKGGLARPVTRPPGSEDDAEFAGLSIFCTRGPLHTGTRIRSGLGVVSALHSVETSEGLLIAAGSLDGKGRCWRLAKEEPQPPVSFATDQQLAVESLRELRFSASGRLLAGWGRLGLHVWSAADGSLQWSYPLERRSVSAHYSLDVVLQEQTDGAAEVWMALPLQPGDPLAPRIHGVRGTDVVAHALNAPPERLSEPLICVESEVEKREFWAIRQRALSLDRRTLFTLSCANVPGEAEQMVVLRRWNLASKSRFGHKIRPQIDVAIYAGLCSQCSPPYAITPDLSAAAFVYAEKMLHLHDTPGGSYSELASGPMGASSRLAIAPGGAWLALACEDSETSEGVVDLWSIQQNQIVQKLYHPWQISALHFADKQLAVALTDGTIQIWNGI